MDFQTFGATHFLGAGRSYDCLISWATRQLYAHFFYIKRPLKKNHRQLVHRFLIYSSAISCIHLTFRKKTYATKSNIWVGRTLCDHYFFPAHYVRKNILGGVPIVRLWVFFLPSNLLSLFVTIIKSRKF